MRKNNSVNITIKKEDDYIKMVDDLPDSNSKESKGKIKATVMDLQILDVSKLQILAQRIFLTGVNIELNLLGNVGIYSAALLSRRFKRTGFAGSNINLAIPASVSQQDKDLLIAHIGLCVKTESSDTVKDLIKKGASISMEEAKELGLIDQVIDLNKRRGSKPTTAVVASDDKPVSENQTATT